MGTIHHHAIIVTSWEDEAIEAAYAEAVRIFPYVSEILPGVINGYRSFFVPPDGSKEWWPDSEVGNERRAAFIDWLRDAYDRELYTEWCEVSYGELGKSIVTRDDEEGDER